MHPVPCNASGLNPFFLDQWFRGRDDIVAVAFFRISKGGSIFAAALVMNTNEGVMTTHNMLQDNCSRHNNPSSIS
jgi:hypothetical protein